MGRRLHSTAMLICLIVKKSLAFPFPNYFPPVLYLRLLPAIVTFISANPVIRTKDDETPFDYRHYFNDAAYPCSLS